MVVIIVNTGHYEFIGLGETHGQATEGLLKRWDEHCERNPDAESGYMQELIEEGSEPPRKSWRLNSLRKR
nr:hypothetical protein [Escherichia coli]